MGGNKINTAVASGVDSEVYSSVLPEWLLVHSAIPIGYTEVQSNPPEWIEGEPGSSSPEPVQGAAFPCVLFMPAAGGAQDTPYRPRVVRTPTLLYNPARDDGSLVVVRAENELLVTASELAPWTGGTTVRWLADGDPQPFGPPGMVYGLMATLRRVED